MATASDLLVRIDATTEALRRELKKGEASVGDFQNNVTRQLGGIDRSFAGMGKGLSSLTSGFNLLKGAFATIGIGIGINALKDLVVNTLDAAGGLGELAQQLGVTTETLQTLTYAGTQYGVTQAEIELGLGKLSKSIGEAAEGGKTAIDAFNRLGVKILDAGGKVRSTDAIFREVIQAISEIEDPATRAATGIDVMGKGFQKLLPLVNEGVAGFDELKKQAKEMGLIFSEDVIKNADIASDKMATLAAVLSAQLTKAMVELAPTITAVVNKMLELINLAVTPDLVGDLVKVNDELVIWKKIVDDAKEDSLTGAVTRLTADVNEVLGGESAIQHVNDLLKERAAIIAKMPTSRFRGPPVAEPVAGGVSNPLPVVTGKSDLDKANDKIQSALDDVLKKTALINAETSEDRLGKNLIEAFDKAGVAIGSFSPKVLELTDAVHTLTDAEEEQEIGTLALAAAKAGDTEGTAKWLAVQKEGVALMEAARTPLEIYNAAIERAGYLLDQGAISHETFNRVVDDAGEAFGAADEDAQRLIASASAVGSGFVNAFLKIGTSIRSVKDLLRELVGVLADVASGLAKEGLSALLTGAFASGPAKGPTAGADLSGLLGSVISMNPFSEGGIMTAAGRVPLRRYSGGGVANTPQLAMYGDRAGGRAEAYVPLPDGRSIPVTMKGGDGGTSVTVVNNITVEGGKDSTQTGAKVGEAVTAAMENFFDERLTYHLRDRGMLRPNTV